MWEITFTPYKPEETIGTIIAIFNKGLSDEFIFTETVNLQDDSGKIEFVLKAKKALTLETKPVPSEITAALSDITTELNK